MIRLWTRVSGAVDRRHRDLEGGREAHVAGLGGEVQLVRAHAPVPVGAEVAIRRGRRFERHLEQRREAQIVLPQGFSLAVVEAADEKVVESLGRVHHHRDRPQHQLGVHRRVGSARRERAGVLRDLAAHAVVEAPHPGEHLVGLGARSEEDRLERLSGMREPLEGHLPRVGVLHRPDEVERVERADHQRPLAVEQPDGALALDSAENRAPTREVAGVVAHQPSSERRPESARPSVTSSACSRSAPTGRPLARRVTVAPPRSRSAMW